MIRFVEKPVSRPAPQETDGNRFDQIRKAAAEKHHKSDTEAARRGKQKTTDDDRLL